MKTLGILLTQLLLQFSPDRFETLQVFLSRSVTFSCNPQINFITFFTAQTWSFWGLKHLDTGYLVNTTPPTVLAGSF